MKYALSLLVLLTSSAMARGVSPYLPLNQSPEIERQIERVLMLADDPVMTRPIAAARVLDALPKACKKDAVLCEQVRRYLSRYMKPLALTQAGVRLAVNSGADKTIPNQRGRDTGSHYLVNAAVQWQPSDYALLSLGGSGWQGGHSLQNSYLSVGYEYAQLDVGYREHWYSPMQDSAMVISTQARAIPSITLSNYTPLTSYHIRYNFFVGALSNSDHIAYNGGFTEGRPRLAGFHLSFEPVPGVALGVNRIMQFGGGARGGNNIKDVFKAFFNPTKTDNTGQGNVTTANEFGNQIASFTAKANFQGRVPFSVYMEYAGEDTSKGQSWVLGNAAFSGGLQFPHILPRLDLSYEFSEWQNAWYVHHIYRDGMTNEGHVLGHWAGDERVFNDGIGGQAHSLIVNWEPVAGHLLEGRLRTLKNETAYGSNRALYHRAVELDLRYSTTWHQYLVGAELYTGKTVFGDHFASIGGFIRW